LIFDISAQLFSPDCKAGFTGDRERPWEAFSTNAQRNLMQSKNYFEFAIGTNF
jgi:hypothetical protein